MKLNYYTDGAATMKKDSEGNYLRQAGGWGVICLNEKMEEVQRLSGGEEETTNNRMELMAIWNALNLAEYGTRNVKGPIIINIYSDSAYCVNIFTQWIKGWISRGWKKADKKPIENLTLIQQIWNKINQIAGEDSFNTINFIKVKGHDDVYWNNEADKLAVAAKEEIQRGMK